MFDAVTGIRESVIEQGLSYPLGNGLRTKITKAVAIAASLTIVIGIGGRMLPFVRLMLSGAGSAADTASGDINGIPEASGMADGDILTGDTAASETVAESYGNSRFPVNQLYADVLPDGVELTENNIVNATDKSVTVKLYYLTQTDNSLPILYLSGEEQSCTKEWTSDGFTLYSYTLTLSPHSESRLLCKSF